MSGKPLTAAALAVAVALCSGCPRTPPPETTPAGACLPADADVPTLVSHLEATRAAMDTLRATHRVVLRVDPAVGEPGEAAGPREMELSGFLAVQYPGKLRLRATSHGVTLFDLLYIDGVTDMLAVHDKLAEKGPVALLWPELSRDLALAFGLEPLPAYERVETSDESWVLHAPNGRTEIDRARCFIAREVRRRDAPDAGGSVGETSVVLSGYAAAEDLMLPRALRVESTARYSVEVVVRKVEPHVELNPKLFEKTL